MPLWSWCALRSTAPISMDRVRLLAGEGHSLKTVMFHDMAVESLPWRWKCDISSDTRVGLSACRNTQRHIREIYNKQNLFFVFRFAVYSGTLCLLRRVIIHLDIIKVFLQVRQGTYNVTFSQSVISKRYRITGHLNGTGFVQKDGSKCNRYCHTDLYHLLPIYMKHGSWLIITIISILHVLIYSDI